MAICTEKIRWPQQPCPFLNRMGEGMRERLKHLSEPVDLASKIVLFTERRFGTFFDSIKGLPPREKIAVIQAAFYVHNNDVLLAHAFAMEFKKTGRPEEAKKIFEVLPRVQTRIPPEKNGLIVGKKGTMIKWIQAKFKSRIDLENNGTVNIYSADLGMAHGAAEYIEWRIRNSRS